MSAAPGIPDAMIDRIVLGRYRILRHLADGGMGAIYLARNEGAAGFVRPVVIKWVLPTHSGDKRITDLFMREARIMAQLSHPQIVSVLDFAEEDGMYIMALEYVHGFTLGRWARYIRKQRGPFPVDLGVHVAIKVLSALDYAHNLQGEDGTPLKIVHRDVTPSNILIDIQGHVKLADFGVAGIASEKTSVGDNTVKGKFAYMPPESFDRVPASAVTDVYSAGVMLHEVLSGSNEFASEQMTETVGRVIRHVPTRMDDLRNDVPAELADAIARALSKDPAQRFPSAGAFARALADAYPLNESAVAERLKAAAAEDFRDERLAQMASMPSLTELESAWRTPMPEGGRPRTTGAGRSVAPPAEPTTLLPQPAISGTTGAPARSKKWLVIGILAAVAVIGALAVVAITALVAAQERDEDQPAFVVVDQRGSAPATADAAIAAALADAGVVADAAALAPPVDAGPRVRPPPPPPNEPDSRQLTRAFGKYTGAVTACFREHADAARSDVAIRFQINEAGKVVSATVLPEQLGATPVGKCLEKVARGAQFGRQREGVTFRVPIQAKPQ